MNILLLTNCIKQPDDIDASTDVVFSFAKEWAAAGNKVVIIHNESKFPLFMYKFPQFIYDWMKKKQNFAIPSISSREKLFREQEGVIIARFPIFKIFPHVSFTTRTYEKQLIMITEYLDSLKFVPDIVTGHWLEPQLRQVYDLGEKYAAKKGFVVHGELPQKINDEYKKYIKSLDFLFFRSQSTAEKMLRKCSYLNSRKTGVCFSGIPEKYISDIHFRTKSEWKKNDIFKLIYVGRLIAYKKIDSVLKALKIAFPDGNYQFDIVGDGSERAELEKICRSNNMQNSVVFHGRISRDEVQTKLREADCFVMISENEVFGLVYLEAMANGCITVASKKGGVDGIIQNGVNGFLCEQGNEKELAQILLNINAMSYTEIAEIRENAAKTVENYTDSKVADMYLKHIIRGK